MSYLSLIYKWIVNSSRWHDLGHGLMGFTAGVLGPYTFWVWVVAVLICDIFIDKHPMNSWKLWIDLATKIIPAILGLSYYDYLRR